MTEVEEIWRPAVGYVGYEVSDQGRVRSVTRTFINRVGKRRTVNGRILKPAADRYGYLVVVLHERSNWRIHRLVLEAFVGPMPVGLQVRHLNGTPSDNRLVNLAYGTPSENSQDAIRHGTHRSASKTRCSRNHILEPPNLKEKKFAEKGWRDCKACARGIRHAARQGTPGRVQEISDEIYAEIMSGRPSRQRGITGVCIRGHRLEVPNLTEAGIRRGVRQCRACSKASGYCRPRRILHEIQAVSDKFYAEIIQPSAATATPPPYSKDKSC